MSRPNVVLIVVDDMGYGDFSAFNEGLSDTPTLDGLIDESVCLTQHYTASPICTPSRAGLMTGRYPHRTGAIDTRESRGLDRLALREVTMADMFSANDYTTGLVGKWHLGEGDMRYHPNSRGFDEFVGFRGGWWWYWDWTLDYNGTFRDSDGRYLTDVFTEEAVDFISRHSEEPFFLNVTYNAPHTPLEAPDEEVESFLEAGQVNRGTSILYGMIKRMDTGVAKILQALEDQGVADNTIVMFTSDNGPQFSGEGDMSIERFNCGFNGSKSHVYEGGIRLPMIIRWPGGLDGGRRVDDMIHFCDWYPSLAAACELDIPEGPALDGTNIWPVVRGESGKVPTKRFWQWNRYSPVGEFNAAIRDGDWKLVRPRTPEVMWTSKQEQEYDLQNKQDPANFQMHIPPEPEREIPEPLPPQLFNIEEDPLEQENLAQKHPDRTRRMLRELENWFEEVEAERATIDDEW
ncbi:MAG: sulfatase-like hydrolase/transferase [Armatimonadota bacterium]